MDLPPLHLSPLPAPVPHGICGRSPRGQVILFLLLSDLFPLARIFYRRASWVQWRWVSLVVAALGLVTSSLALYSGLESLDRDPAWSIRLAQKHCQVSRGSYCDNYWPFQSISTSPWATVVCTDTLSVNPNGDLIATFTDGWDTIYWRCGFVLVSIL